MVRKRRQHKKNHWGWIIIIVMISSVFGVMFGSYSSPEDKLEYEDYSFTRTNAGWRTEIDGSRYTFDYFPAEVVDINISDTIMARLKGTYMLYMTSLPDDTSKEAIAQFEFELANFFAENLDKYAAIGLATENEFDVPIITCDNATQFVPVIYLESSNETSVTLVDDCIIVSSRSLYGFTQLKDRITYGILGII